MKYGRFIREEVKRQGKTLDDMAAGLGISRQALYKRLTGDIRMSNLEKTLDYLGYEVRIGKKK